MPGMLQSVNKLQQQILGMHLLSVNKLLLQVVGIAHLDKIRWVRQQWERQTQWERQLRWVHQHHWVVAWAHRTRSRPLLSAHLWAHHFRLHNQQSPPRLPEHQRKVVCSKTWTTMQ